MTADQLKDIIAAGLACEHITLEGDGRSFADVSSWYWSAVTGRSRGPWWARTIAVVAQ